ncbi:MULTISPECIES: sensor domain-containing protein [unclassified Mycobacteroides]|uniref:sensor domain-containing protein n=1 Tax=unclassified Mycobacteroides TaxID=2618759 RepID=UPI0013967F1B|nr:MULTISPECIES: sensor domain-containing protein [unclassified Mycobacteroides]
MLLTSCAHPVGGSALVAGTVKALYPNVRPDQKVLSDKLLTAEEIGAATGIPGLMQVRPIASVISTANIVSDCAFGATLATRQQYLSFAAARVQTATKVADGVRESTISNALVVFESVSTAAQQFEQFASRMQRCDGVSGEIGTGTSAERWRMHVLRSDDGEVSWTRANDSGRWSCQMMATPRANYIASVMYCRRVDSGDKSERLLDALLNKLFG